MNKGRHIWLLGTLEYQHHKLHITSQYNTPRLNKLTHWDRVTHICIRKLTITGSDNGLSPHQHQAIIWTNAGILLIGPLGTNFSEISIKIHTLSFKEMLLNMSSAKWQPFCLCLNVLTHPDRVMHLWARPSLVQIMACRLISNKPLSDPMLAANGWLDP